MLIIVSPHMSGLPLHQCHACMASHHFDVSIKINFYGLKPIQSRPMYC